MPDEAAPLDLRSLVVGRCKFCRRVVSEEDSWGPSAVELDGYPPKATPVYHTKCFSAAGFELIEADVSGEVKRQLVKRFWIDQATSFFPEGAPDRASYDTGLEGDRAHEEACREYMTQWLIRYECGEVSCANRDCPQHGGG